MIDEGGNVLLVKHSYGQLDTWILPGGGVVKRENPEAAVRRELEEELGLHPARVDLFGTYVSSREGKSDAIFVFVAQGSAAPRISSREISEAQFFAPQLPPEGTSPATRRRLEELTEGKQRSGNW